MKIKIILLFFLSTSEVNIKWHLNTSIRIEQEEKLTTGRKRRSGVKRTPANDWRHRGPLTRAHSSVGFDGVCRLSDVSLYSWNAVRWFLIENYLELTCRSLSCSFPAAGIRFTSARSNGLTPIPRFVYWTLRAVLDAFLSLLYCMYAI